jgi:YegS/Rv2252/BmrU family lipid kinase
MQRLLLIVNPCAGTKRIPRFFPQIIELFRARGFESTVYMTNGRGDATDIVRERGGDFDRIVCAGGDGTFNEVITGLLSAGLTTPLGYIPCGSTNDFATTLRLPKTIMEAAASAAGETSCALDVGQFGDRYFSYVASFGAFARTSYATPQSVKNALGHLAYVLQGISDIPSIRPLHMRLELDDLVFEDDYIFGAVSNSTSVGGVLTLDESRVDLNDGLFELVLIKSPKDIFELSECIRALSAQDYSSKMITFVSAPEVRAFSGETLDWTLDGECMPDVNETTIRNLRSAITLYC